MITALNLKYTKTNIVNGALIYTCGDLIASILLNEFSFTRLFGMVFIGATFYAIEIPNYFTWIDSKTKHIPGIKKTLAKTGLAIAYFNPLWIARHLFFIALFSANYQSIGMNLLKIASLSFLVNIPISFVANYIIQNKISLSWRFIASAIFSGLMAIYYAFSEVLFN